MVQITIFLGICIGYISTYIFRVANKVGLFRNFRLKQGGDVSQVSYTKLPCACLGCWHAPATNSVLWQCKLTSASPPSAPAACLDGAA